MKRKQGQTEAALDQTSTTTPSPSCLALASNCCKETRCQQNIPSWAHTFQRIPTHPHLLSSSNHMSGWHTCQYSSFIWSPVLSVCSSFTHLTAPAFSSQDYPGCLNWETTNALLPSSVALFFRFSSPYLPPSNIALRTTLCFPPPLFLLHPFTSRQQP